MYKHGVDPDRATRCVKAAALTAKLPQLAIRVDTGFQITTVLGVLATVVLLFVLWKVLRRIFPRM
jgi:hypothetical protein